MEKYNVHFLNCGIGSLAKLPKLYEKHEDIKAFCKKPQYNFIQQGNGYGYKKTTTALTLRDLIIGVLG